ALALAIELPRAQVVATDKSEDAVEIALANAASLKVPNIAVRQSDWFGALQGEKFDLIAANPPYIDPLDPHLLDEVRYEPQEALIADDHGLGDLKKIIQSAPRNLNETGWLLLEHGFEQGTVVRELLRAAGFKCVQTFRDLSGNDRVTEGQWKPA
ncbi:MAG: peptide chain release factor N(5)-glutamine methyltransferase, partial [bacterium]